MKVTLFDGNQYRIDQKLDASSVYLKIEFSAPGGRFFKTRALLDTGCSGCLVLPKALLDEIGLSERLETVGSESNDTANGPVREDVVLVDLGVISGAGRVLFEGVEASVNSELDDALIGMGILRFFNIQLRNGRLEFMEINSRSFEVPGSIMGNSTKYK